jgi:hypothetical protein
MPLIQCPNCQRDIASTCDNCSYCGYKLKANSYYEAEEAEKDDRSEEYLSIGIKISFGALILIVIVFAFAEIKKSQMKSITNAIEAQKTEAARPNKLLLEAKALYNEGKFANAQLVLNEILNNYRNSEIIKEASKFKFIVDSALKVRKEKERVENERLKKIRAQEERKHEKELENLYEKDVIRYYKNLYGKPDSETDFTYDTYINKTLTWNCASGRYRSITFEYKYGSWWKESEYARECIN